MAMRSWSSLIVAQRVETAPEAFEDDDIAVPAERTECRRNLVQALSVLLAALQPRALHDFHIELQRFRPRAIGCQELGIAGVEHENTALGLFTLEIAQKSGEPLRAVARGHDECEIAHQLRRALRTKRPPFLSMIRTACKVVRASRLPRRGMAPGCCAHWWFAHQSP